MPFDKKLACLTNYQERRSFPWALVSYKEAKNCSKTEVQFLVSMKHYCLVVYACRMGRMCNKWASNRGTVTEEKKGISADCLGCAGL